MNISLSEAELSLQLNETNIVNTIPTVFCDCDGVLADFNGMCRTMFNKRTNEEVEDYLNNPATWPELARTHQKLFRMLQPLEDARDLVDELVSLRNNQLIRLKVLTALPNSWMDSDIKESAIADKKQWVNKNFPAIEESDVIVCRRSEKAAYGMADKLVNRVAPILIDDYSKNLTEWVAHTRGYAIEHTNAKSSLNQLKIHIKGSLIGELMPGIFDAKLQVEMVEETNSDLIIPITLTVEETKPIKSVKPQKAGKDPAARPVAEPEAKPVGLDHKGEAVVSNKRDIPFGKGQDPKYDQNNKNAGDGPVPATVSGDKSVIILHPPENLKHVTRKDKIGLRN